MSKTIKSSWEFLDVIFSIRNVSRACAQQITRTRFTPIDGDIFGSYAMQSQRVTDMSNATWHNPFFGRAGADVNDELSFDDDMQLAISRYRSAVEEGMNLEDARGLLPVNLHCNLIAKYNLRMLSDLIQARSSYRAQGEFNNIAKEMRAALVDMWPWAHLFLRPREELAKAAMDDVRAKIAIAEEAGKDGNLGPKQMHEIKIALAKLDDIVQGGK
jgi:flavin-dependent thymidylate synthase